MFIASKLLAFLVAPFNWFFLLLLFALKAKSDVARKRWLILSVIFLLIFSNQYLYQKVSTFWSVPPVPKEHIENYDIAIVLGGVSSWNPVNNQLDFNQNVDRLMQAVLLYKEEKVKKILISGGSGLLFDQDIKEADLLHDFLIEIGIPEKDIIIERESRNTYENALYTTKLIKETYPGKKLVLVTNSEHMRRAKACFKKQGLDVLVFPIGHIKDNGFFQDLLIPNFTLMITWYDLMHEMIGTLVYQWKGYII